MKNTLILGLLIALTACGQSQKSSQHTGELQKGEGCLAWGMQMKDAPVCTDKLPLCPKGAWKTIIKHHPSGACRMEHSFPPKGALR